MTDTLHIAPPRHAPLRTASPLDSARRIATLCNEPTFTTRTDRILAGALLLFGTTTVVWLWTYLTFVLLGD